jgi:hypothetical protein
MARAGFVNHSRSNSMYGAPIPQPPCAACYKQSLQSSGQILRSLLIARHL